MASLRGLHQLNALEAHADEDGFEFVGTGLVLFFVSGRGTQSVQRDFVLCSSVREAKREMKARRAAGWKCCWKVFGQVHLPGEMEPC
jgi:hypothetical protein